MEEDETRGPANSARGGAALSVGVMVGGLTGGGLAAVTGQGWLVVTCIILGVVIGSSIDSQRY